MKWYTDGTNNFTTDVGLVGNTASSYVQATGTQGTTGDELTTSAYSTLAGAPSNMFAYTSGATLTVPTTSTTSASVDLGDFVVLQITVGSTAVAGATGQETMTFQYEES